MKLRCMSNSWEVWRWAEEVEGVVGWLLGGEEDREEDRVEEEIFGFKAELQKVRTENVENMSMLG